MRVNITDTINLPAERDAGFAPCESLADASSPPGSLLTSTMTKQQIEAKARLIFADYQKAGEIPDGMTFETATYDYATDATSGEEMSFSQCLSEMPTEAEVADGAWGEIQISHHIPGVLPGCDIVAIGKFEVCDRAQEVEH